MIQISHKYMTELVITLKSAAVVLISTLLVSLVVFVEKIIVIIVGFSFVNPLVRQFFIETKEIIGCVIALLALIFSIFKIIKIRKEIKILDSNKPKI